MVEPPNKSMRLPQRTILVAPASQARASLNPLFNPLIVYNGTLYYPEVQKESESDCLQELCQ
jgi:hypothetical protein